MRVPNFGSRKVSDIIEAVAVGGARVRRDSLVEFLLGGGFASLPVLPQAVIDNPAGRPAEAGWVIPPDSLGRKIAAGGSADHSTGQSVNLWIKKNLGDYIDAEKVSVCFDGSDVLIYRKG